MSQEFIAMQNEIQILNYMIAGLGFIVSAFAAMIWHSIKAERQNMKDAITAIENTIERLDKQYEVQSKMIRIIARQTDVEIGE